jgi:hypothetical protein
MTDQQLGSANYTPGTGDFSGDDLSAAGAQLQSGDTAKLALTFPLPISGIPADGIAAVLSPIFGLFGQTLLGVDFDGDSTLVLVWRVG